jgi:hypothetical protein
VFFRPNICEDPGRKAPRRSQLIEASVERLIEWTRAEKTANAHQ